MNQPFLTIVTRCCKRPKMLSGLIESVLRQTDRDIEQVFIVDKVGSHPEGNVLWANRQFAPNAHRVQGKYVLFKDDDTVLVSRRLVEDMKALIRKRGSEPDAFLVRSITGAQKVGSIHFLPLDDVWRLDWDKGKRPKRWAGHGGNLITKSHVWKRHIKTYNNHPRGADWHFITAVISSKISVAKLDIVASASVQRGRGVVFEKCGPNWFEGVAKRYGITNLGRSDWRLRLFAQRT